MSIRLTCSCGRSLSVKAETAGQQVRCPSCQAVLTVPGPHDDVPTALPVEEQPPRSAIQTGAGGASGHRPRLRAEPLRPEPSPRRPALRDHDDDFRKRRRRSRAGYEGSIWAGRTGSIIAGVLMMVLGGGWFAAEWLLAGGFHCYSLVLCVLGVVALVRGILGHD
jgi:hypothetical protein